MNTSNKSNPIVPIIVTLIIFEVISMAIGYSTAPKGDGGWYDSLILADITPPNWVFGAVWPALYALLAVSFGLLWSKRDESSVSLLLTAFIIHMILNWSWNFVFFEFHMLFEAFILLALISVYASLMTLAIVNKHMIAGLLWLPYLIWLAYATYLSGFIYMSN